MREYSADGSYLNTEWLLIITGNADEPTGLVFTDESGRQLEPCGAPKPPDRLELPANRYRPPLMGPVEWDWLTVSWPDPVPT